MSQSTSINQTVLDSPENPTKPASWSEESDAHSVGDPNVPPVESYADKLMDELFEDVDRILDRGVKLPTEPAKPEYVSLQSLSIPKMLLPPMLMPRQLAQESDVELNELVTAAIADSSQRQASNSIDRLLLIAACASLVVTGALWFTFHNRSQRTAAPDPAPTATELQAQGDAEFLDYMQRSLEVIDRKSDSRQLAIAPGAPPGALPNVTVTGSSQPGTAPTVLERVYIPVYQPPQTLYPLPNVAPAPATAPATASAPTAPRTAVAPVPNLATSATHVLVGVLQLGDRSAALFEINGVAQRVYIGESIGVSGWTLVSVTNQEAIVRRNGEVRSIYVGQQF